MKSNIIIIFILVCSCKSKVNNDRIIAKIEEKNIYLSEIDKPISNKLNEYLYSIYVARKFSLEEITGDLLIKKEIENSKKNEISLINKLEKSNGFSLDNFILKHGLTENIIDPTNPFKKILTNSAEGQSLLKKEYQLFLRNELVKNLKNKYDYVNFLRPPLPQRIEFFHTIKHNFKHNQNNKIKFWIISNLECHSCKELHNIFESVIFKNKEVISVKQSFLNSYLDIGSKVGEFANRKGKFFEFYDEAMKIEKIDSNKIFNIIKAIGLDGQECQDYINDKRNNVYLQNSFNELKSNQIITTPTLIINNRIYNGEYDENSINEFINNLLENK